MSAPNVPIGAAAHDATGAMQPPDDSHVDSEAGAASSRSAPAVPPLSDSAARLVNDVVEYAAIAAQTNTPEALSRLATAENVLRATLAAAERRAEEAERRLAMPGQWTCDVCGYGESRAIISAINGAAKANPLADDPRCPNDHEPLRPLRWDEAGREARALSRELADQLAASEAALAEARKDTERLDWLEAHGSYVTHPTEKFGWETHIAGENGEYYGGTAREAIDAALARAPREEAAGDDTLIRRMAVWIDHRPGESLSVTLPQNVSRALLAMLGHDDVRIVPEATLAAAERERDEARQALDAIWNHCRVIYYPRYPEHPIEHSARARVDMRRTIESRLAADAAAQDGGR